MSEWTHTLDGVRCKSAKSSMAGKTEITGFAWVSYENVSGCNLIPLVTWERAIPIPQPIERTHYAIIKGRLP